jgi:HK97 family phage major capsid protein
MKALVEKRNALLDEMESVVSAMKTEVRSLTETESARMTEIKAEIRAIDESIALEEEVRGMEKTATVVKPVQTEAEVRALEVAAEEKRFLDFIKGDQRALDAASNGAVIPKSIANRVIDKVINISPLLSQVEIFRVKGDLVFPTYDYTQHTTAYTTEFTDLVASGGVFGQVTLTNLIIGTLAKIGKSLINRSEIDVTSYIVNAIAKSIALFLENELIKGVGGAGKLKGLAQIDPGQVTTGATTLVIDSAELIKLQMQIPQSMNGNCKWLMHPNTLAYIQGLKATTGQFLMGNTLSENGSYVLLGKEVMLSDAMPQIGVNALEIFYGDFSGLYMKVTNDVQVQVLTELYAAQYAIGIAAFAEVDSVIVEKQKLVAYKGK